MSAVPVGYKQTEVGVMPADWDAVEMEKITADIGDGLHGTPIYSSNGDYFFVNGNNLNGGNVVITSDTKSVDFTEFMRHRKPLSKRSILLSINGTIGNLALFNDEQIVLGKSAAYLNVRPEVCKYFVYYALQTDIVRRQFLDGLTGSTIGNLGLATIRKTQLPLPSTFAEQQTIATALSDADTLLAKLDQFVAKKRSLKQAAMQQLLTGQTRLPGFSEAWEVKRLGDLLAYQQPTKYLVSSSEYSDSNDVPVLTAGKTFVLGYTHETEGIFTDLPTILFDDFTTATKYVNFSFKAKSSAMKILKPRSPSVNLRLVYQIMQLIDFKLGDHKRYWISEYSKLEVKLPEIAEQTAIATVLSDMDAELAALEARRDKTRALKQGMMQELLTGRIRLV
jgi:type I restriction enzyme S subunit